MGLACLRGAGERVSLTVVASRLTCNGGARRVTDEILEARLVLEMSALALAEAWALLKGTMPVPVWVPMLEIG